MGVVWQALVMSDIHGNLQALEKVLACKAGKRANEIWVLGDCENYGADSAAVITSLRDDPRVKVMLAGNHTRLMRGDHDPAEAGGEFTGKALVLADHARREIETAGHMGWLRELPTSVVKTLDQIQVVTEEMVAQPAPTTVADMRWGWQQPIPLGGKLVLTGLQVAIRILDLLAKPVSPEPQIRTSSRGVNVLCVHGSPANPAYGYLRPQKDAAILEAAGQAGDVDVVLCGHTHQPMVAIVSEGQVFWPKLTMGEVFEVPLDGSTVFINPGSAGQPRDGGGKAQYGLLRVKEDDQGQRTLVWIQQDRRYDVAAAQAAIRALKDEVSPDQVKYLEANATRLKPII